MLLFLLACRPDTGFTKHNAEPVAQILDPVEDAALREGDPLLLRGQASDPDDSAEDLLVRWLADSVEICPDAGPEGDGSATCAWVVPSSVSEIVLEVRDPDGAVGVDRVQVDLDAGTAPRVTITAPTAGQALYADQLVPLEAIVSDAEDAAETLVGTWSSSEIGVLGAPERPSSEGVLLDAQTLTEGQHLLTLTVVDLSGNEGVDSVVVDVGPANTPPSCAITAPADNSVWLLGQPVDLRGMVSDPDIGADQLTATWGSDQDGVLGTLSPDSSGDVGLTIDSLSANIHRLTLQVADEVGATCTTSVYVAVGTPPVLDVVSPRPDEVWRDGTVWTFEGVVSDDQDVPSLIEVSWESDRDGLLDESAPDASGNLAFDAALSAGSHLLTVTATDTTGLSTAVVVPLRVDEAPGSPGISLIPVAPYTDDDLVVQLNRASVDPEGDPVSYRYDWTVDGAPSAASSSGSLPATTTTRGERWEVTVTAEDPWGTGGSASASVTILNSPPELVSAQISPALPALSDTLTCAGVGYTDADGDPDSSAVSWEINGVSAGAGSSFAGPFSTGDVVTCTVTPFDGLDSGAPVSSSVSFVDGPPSVTSVIIDPDPAFTDDTLVAQVVASDPDGDPVSLTYAWVVNGVLVGVDPTLDGAWFSKNDVVYVEVTPNDGRNTGSVARSADRVISNTAPGSVSLILDPSAPAVGDSLWCQHSVASDADGDPLDYVYAWDVDGVPFTGTTTTGDPDDTVPAGVLAAGETWTCEVYATDGTDDGPLASTSVTVPAASACPGGNCALRFDGAGDYVRVPDDPTLDGGARDLTVEAWIWFDQVTSNCMTIARKGTASSSTYDYWLHKNMGPADSLYWASNSGYSVIGWSAVGPGQWYHYAGVYDAGSGSASIYLNGTQWATSAASTPTSNNEDVLIGMDWDSGCGMDGVIDEVRISSSVRYTGAFSPATSFSADADTLALWHFDEYTGSVVYDSSGNGNDGTVVGATWTTEHP